MRGITLEEIAEATKIGTRSLRALELQDFDKLPGGIFNKGFVRAYSKYLGIDEEQAVADYVAAVNEAQAASKAQAANAATETLTIIAEEEPQPPRWLKWVPVALLVVVVAAVVFGGWKLYSWYGLPHLRTAKAASRQEPVSPARNAVKTAQAPIQQLAGVPESGVTLRIRARQATWVSIVADGKPVMSGVLAASAEKSVHAEREVVIKTGNAAGVEVFQNDKPLPTLGAENQVKTITFTPEGVRN